MTTTTIEQRLSALENQASRLERLLETEEGGTWDAERLANDLPEAVQNKALELATTAKAVATIVLDLVDDYDRASEQLEALLAPQWRRVRDSGGLINDVAEALCLENVSAVLGGLSEHITNTLGGTPFDGPGAVKRCRALAAELVNEEGPPCVVWNPQTLAVAEEVIEGERERFTMWPPRRSS